MLRFARFFSVAVGVASVLALTATAQAQPRKHRHYNSGASVAVTDVVVVHPRPFTDSGNLVPVGSRNGYVQQLTHYAMEPYEKFSPGVIWRPEPQLMR